MTIDGTVQCLSIGTLMTVCPFAPFVAGTGKAAEETMQNI